MNWTENKWLKPAWMSGGNDFVTQYQDKFVQIGEKFAPKSKRKKDDGPNGIRLAGSIDDIDNMVAIFKFAFEDGLSFNKKWKSILFGSEGDKYLNTFHKHYLSTVIYPNQQIFFRLKRGIRGYIDRFGTGEVKIDDYENITNGESMNIAGKRIFTLLSIVLPIIERFAIENYEEVIRKYNAAKYEETALLSSELAEKELDELRKIYRPAHNRAKQAELGCLIKIYKQMKWNEGSIYSERNDLTIEPV